MSNDNKHTYSSVIHTEILQLKVDNGVNIVYLDFRLSCAY